MNKHLYFLTIPGLRQQDIAQMPNLSELTKDGDRATLRHSFPAVTWPAQANMLTGATAEDHGVVANGFYWRDKNKVEMWTAWNEVIQQPQIWDVLKTINPDIKSAAWFPMLSKGSGADYVCMPAPIHKPDGSEELWCYTKPQEFYGELLNSLGHFPLQHFWGPLSNIKSSKWIADSALAATKQFEPNFFYIYLPHLDYAAQKHGPDSPQANQAIVDLDNLIGEFTSNVNSAMEDVVWIVASEYVIHSVDHVTFPNRVLRAAGLLSVKVNNGLEYLDFENSEAWALVDHQFSHVFVKDSNVATIDKVTELFSGQEGIECSVAGGDRAELNLDHPRSGDVVLLSTPNSWQAYYWWTNDSLAPDFARNVDIHQKPGYDPVELHFDMTTKSVPLDATLIKGSHGGLPKSNADYGIIHSNRPNLFGIESIADTEVFEIVLEEFRQ